MTNFDRIKQMTVEEMAEWLDSFSYTNCECCAYKGAPCSGVTCEEGHTKWLESEVTE